MADKCMDCLTVHPVSGFGWELYDHPVYWALPNDGASFPCHDCKTTRGHNHVWLTQIPCGHRLVVCKDCIEPDWIEMAEFRGVYNA